MLALVDREARLMSRFSEITGMLNKLMNDWED